MVLEESELAIRPVTDPVGVLARIEIDVRMPCVDPDAVRVILRLPWLGQAVASDRRYLEADTITIAETVPVVRGEVPEDASADHPALGPDTDRLLHGHGSVLFDRNVAVIAEDAFVGDGGKGPQCAGRQDDDQGCRPTACHGFISTRGVSRTPSSATAKNSAARNPNGRATSRSGKVSIRVLKIRTEPL